VLAVVSFFNHSSGRRKVAQQSVQRIFGSLWLRESFFWLQVFSALKLFLTRPKSANANRWALWILGEMYENP